MVDAEIVWHSITIALDGTLLKSRKSIRARKRDGAHGIV
jgi:hypothetical protein